MESFSSNSLGTATSKSLEALLSLAADICVTPLALLSINKDGQQCLQLRIDAHNAFQAFAREASRESVISREVWCESVNAKLDFSLEHHSTGKGKKALKFSARAFFRSKSGRFTGSLRVMDTRVRRLNVKQRRALLALAECVAVELSQEETIADLRNQCSMLNASQVAAGIGSVEWNLRKRTMIWSENQYAIFGVNPSTTPTYEIYLSHFSEEDQNEIKMRLEAATESHPEFQREYRIVRSNGEIRTLRQTGKVDFDEAGSVYRVRSTSEDITEQRKRAENMPGGQPDFKALFSNVPVGIFIFDAQTKRLKLCNPAALTSFGLREVDLHSVSVHDLIAASESNIDVRIGSAFDAVATGSGTIRRSRDYFRHKNGTIFQVDYTCSPICRDNQIVEVAVSFTESKDRRIDDQMDFSEVDLKSLIFDALPVGVFAKDIRNEGRFVTLNRAGAAIIGIKTENFVGKKENQLFENENVLRTNAQEIELLLASSGDSITETSVLKTGGGYSNIKITRCLAQDDLGRPAFVLGVLEDITANTEIEKSASNMQTRKLIDSKFAALGAMAGSIAHEINNPLAIIRGKTGLLRQLSHQSNFSFERLNSDLTKIESSVDRIAKIISSLRLFSRNTEADPKITIALTQIISDTMELCRERLYQHGVGVRFEIDPTVKVLCRPTEISQILLNLIDNSFDAIEERAERWISLIVKSELRVATILVIDSGTGIPADVEEQIMLPFYTTKPPGRGVGLGLTISRCLAEAHGGSLTYLRVGVNTGFLLTLPQHFT